MLNFEDIHGKLLQHDVSIKINVKFRLSLTQAIFFYLQLFLNKIRNAFAII